MKRPSARVVGTLVGLAIAAAFMWLAVRDVDAGEVWSAMRSANPWLLAVTIVVATSGYFVRALRWRVLLAPVCPGIGVGARFRAIMIGFMVNNVLPGRVGEVARAFALTRMAPVGMGGALGSLAVERTLDAVVLLLFLVVPLMAGGFPAEGALSSGVGGTVFRAAVVGVGAILALVVLLVAWPGVAIGVGRRAVERLERKADQERMAQLAGRFVDAMADFLGALRALRSPRLLAAAIGWTFALWLWHGFSFYLGMLALGIDTGFVSALFTEAVVGWVVAVPGAPGFIGNFQFGVDFALSDTYGASAPSVLAFAFAYHVGGWFPVTFIGLYYAARMGLTRRELQTGDVGAGDSGGSGVAV